MAAESPSPGPSAELTPAASSFKRFGDDDMAKAAAVTHTRKRNRYISIACNECKRRKIKCNGNTPCQRCGNLGLQCQYAPNCCSTGFKDSDEFRHINDHLAALQDQVNGICTTLSAMAGHGPPGIDGFAYPPPPSDAGSPAMSLSSPSAAAAQPTSPASTHRSQRQSSSFRGPTSSVYHLNVAKKTLHDMGYQGLSDREGSLPTAEPPTRSAPRIQDLISTSPSSPRAMREPLWSIPLDEVLRLIHSYEEDLGDLYPVIDVAEMAQHANNLFEHAQYPPRSRPMPNVNDEQSCVLKLVLACALITESNGESEIGHRLFESTREVAYRSLHTEIIDVHKFPLLILVAIYHYHCDEENLAWRLNGQVARMCFELGLHRKEALDAITDPLERKHIIRIFWSIYVLDRRWSFGTGMPFALKQEDFDPGWPRPDFEDFPYLNLMIEFAQLTTSFSGRLNAFDASPFSFDFEELRFFDYQLQQWQNSFPPELRLPPPTAPPPSSRLQHRLQSLLYLRANQGRILLRRPVLHSATTIQSNMVHATTVVEIAQDSIRTLTHLNQTTDIYRRQQVAYNYFLVSALAVLFLASCHAPVQFSPLCREEFFMALDLVKGFSERSYVSKRLWGTIKNLKEIGPKLGLSAPARPMTEAGSNVDEDPHASAAMAMAGMAGQQPPGPASISPIMPQQPTRTHASYTAVSKGNPRGVGFGASSVDRNADMIDMVSAPIMTAASGGVSSSGPAASSGIVATSPWDSTGQVHTGVGGGNSGGGPAAGRNGNGFQLSHEMTNLFEAAMGSASRGGVSD